MLPGFDKMSVPLISKDNSGEGFMIIRYVSLLRSGLAKRMNIPELVTVLNSPSISPCSVIIAMGQLVLILAFVVANLHPPHRFPEVTWGLLQARGLV
jgi:hypothetical protein